MTQETMETGRFALSGVLTMRAVEEIHTKLREALAAHQVVELDCTEASEVDLGFVQLLVAARSSARHAGKSITLAARPEGALLDALTRGGFRITAEERLEGPQGFWFEGAAQS
jgi:ABC-type transporter Mla MlaB component